MAESNIKEYWCGRTGRQRSIQALRLASLFPQVLGMTRASFELERVNEAICTRNHAYEHQPFYT